MRHGGYNSEQPSPCPREGQSPGEDPPRGPPFLHANDEGAEIEYPASAPYLTLNNNWK